MWKDGAGTTEDAAVGVSAAASDRRDAARSKPCSNRGACHVLCAALVRLLNGEVGRLKIRETECKRDGASERESVCMCISAYTDSLYITTACFAYLHLYMQPHALTHTARSHIFLSDQLVDLRNNLREFIELTKDLLGIADTSGIYLYMCMYILNYMHGHRCFLNVCTYVCVHACIDTRTHTIPQ